MVAELLRYIHVCSSASVQSTEQHGFESYIHVPEVNQLKHSSPGVFIHVHVLKYMCMYVNGLQFTVFHSTTITTACVFAMCCVVLSL